jgi:hypothetical protein
MHAHILRFVIRISCIHTCYDSNNLLRDIDNIYIYIYIYESAAYASSYTNRKCIHTINVYVVLLVLVRTINIIYDIYLNARKTASHDVIDDV